MIKYGKFEFIEIWKPRPRISEERSKNVVAHALIALLVGSARFISKLPLRTAEDWFRI